MADSLPPLPTRPDEAQQHTQSGEPSSAQISGNGNMPSINFVPATGPSVRGRPPLIFSKISRTLPSTSSIVRVGRYSEKDNASEPKPGYPSDAPVGFKSKVVSRRHCEFFFTDQWYIRDVKSSSGTFLNHIRLSSPGNESKPFPVKDGDLVQLGIDFKGGEENIFRCVKIQVEINRGWQQGLNKFNKSTYKQLKQLSKGTDGEDNDAASKHSTECTICLNSIQPCQALFVAPCSHTWHWKCIRQMVTEQASYPRFICPNCRAVADLEAEIEEEELVDYDEEAALAASLNDSLQISEGRTRAGAERRFATDETANEDEDFEETWGAADTPSNQRFQPSHQDRRRDAEVNYWGLDPAVTGMPTWTDLTTFHPGAPVGVLPVLNPNASSFAPAQRAPPSSATSFTPAQRTSSSQTSCFRLHTVPNPSATSSPTTLNNPPARTSSHQQTPTTPASSRPMNLPRLRIIEASDEMEPVVETPLQLGRLSPPDETYGIPPPRERPIPERSASSPTTATSPSAPRGRVLSPDSPLHDPQVRENWRNLCRGTQYDEAVRPTQSSREALRRRDTLTSEGPMTPRNNAGPWVFDAEAIFGPHHRD